jgi:hypothetical protein
MFNVPEFSLFNLEATGKIIIAVAEIVKTKTQR